MEDTHTSYEQEKRDYLLRETMKWSEALTSNAFAILRDWSLAEDAFQESLIVVNQKWEEFEDGRPVLPWVRRIVNYKALNLLKKNKREVSIDDEQILDLIDFRIEEYLETKAGDEILRRQQALDQCVSKLPASDRGVVLGFYMEGKDCETLGKSLKKSANAIRIMLSRARSQLRDCVNASI